MNSPMLILLYLFLGLSLCLSLAARFRKAPRLFSVWSCLQGLLLAIALPISFHSRLGIGIGNMLGLLLWSVLPSKVAAIDFLYRWRRGRSWILSGLFSLTLLSSFQLELLLDRPALAATENIAAGAYVIDMGQATQTVANGLKPYGLLYELVVTKGVPVKWAIDPSKAREGVDFVANGKSYKGGSFIIDSAYAADALSSITAWKAQGVVVDGPIASGFTAPIYDTITSFPNAVLDFQNGIVTQAYYTNAGIPATSTGTFGTFNTYRFGYPSSLTACDDIFVMPHADPTWANHQNLLSFVQSKGFVWAACHAVSVLERLDDPGDADTLPDLNFLSHIPPAIQDSQSLKLFGTHALPTVGPYQYANSTGTSLPYGYLGSNLWAYPIMQFLGKIDTATQNGSEQIYIPDAGAQWRNETAIAVYDDNNTDAVAVPTKGIAPPASQVKAAKMAFGPAFGNSNYGMVMYEAGHSHAKATAADNIAAQRAFFNFVLLNGLARGVKVSVDIPSSIAAGTTVNLATSNGGGSAVQVVGGSGPYRYQWYNNCGGSFSNSTAQSPTFTAPANSAVCTLRVVINDGCNRRAFGSDIALVPSNTNVSIAKSDGVTQVAPGQSVPYTITVTNKGTGTIAGVQIQDRAFNGSPNGTVWATSTPSTGNGNALNLSGSNDPFYGQLDKTTYANNELLVSNISVGSFKNSAGTAVTKIDLRNAADTPAINTYNWTGLNLAPGQSATLVLTGVFNLTTSENYIANFITAQPIDASNVVLTDTDPSDNRYYDADKLFAPVKTPDLKVTKTHTPAIPRPGDLIIYTVMVQNLDKKDDAAANVVFTDLVPSSIDVSNWSCTVTNGGKTASNTSCGTPNTQTKTSSSINNINGTTTITGMKLSKSDSTNTTTLTFTFNGTVTSNIGNGIIANNATIMPNSADADLDLTNNTATDSFTIPTADLEITKSDGQTIAIAGTDVTYSITVKNNGPNTVKSFSIEDVLPSQLTLNTPAISNVSSGTFNYNPGNGQGLWAGLNLKTGGTVSLSLNTHLKPNAVGTLQSGQYFFTNTAKILTTGITGLDSNNLDAILVETNSSNNTSDDTNQVQYQSDISMTKSDGVSYAQQNDILTYTIKLTNNGPSDVTNFTMSERVTSNGLTNAVFGTPSQGFLNPANPSFVYNPTTGRDEAAVNWSGLSLSSGQSASITLTGKVLMANGTLSNLAIVNLPSGYTDPNPGNNQSEDINTVSTAPPNVDLVIQKDDNQTVATPGQAITYLIRVINKSNIAVDSIKVLDIIPPDLTNVQLYATSGEYDSITGSWTNIFLEPNGDETNPNNTPNSFVTLILEGVVSSTPTQAKLTNTATVEAPASLKALETITSNNVAIDEDSYPVTKANILLVNRITAINGDSTKNPHDNTALNTVVHNSAYPNDDHPSWPSGYLVGAYNGGRIEPGDDIEYTVYFMNASGASASSVKICNRMLGEKTFLNDAYGTGKDVQFKLGTGSILNLTRGADTSDRAQFYTAGTAPPASCNLPALPPVTTDNGTLAIDITGTGSIVQPDLAALPGATGQGTPTNSYGYFRFKSKINP
jgi:uncharacterized repeat protein (TIGR01451 family)